MMKSKSLRITAVAVLLLTLFGIYKKSTQLKLYWFIPDGLRAEPTLFQIFKWADEGKLPNIKKLKDNGSFGYSYPNFPSHTPTNFATLLTGSYPDIHGVNDGPMHTLGKPLDSVAIGGFRSNAKKVDPIWKTLEKEGLKVALMSIPGSTPPEIEKGVVVRGRWGGWGADFAALNFETKGNLAQRVKQGRAARFFYFGPQLTLYSDSVNALDWKNAPKSMSTPKEINLTGWGATIYGYIYDSTDDGQVNYDSIAFSSDKKQIYSDLKQGQWSDWEDVTLKWVVGEKTTDVATQMKIVPIKIGEDGFFRVRIIYNNLNQYITYPSTFAELLQNKTGPMVDFVDNFPPQLVYYPEDKQIFIDEAKMSFDWHIKSVSTLVEQSNPNIVIHDIYTPNQMLTSRWWMGYVDPKSSRYNDINDQQRNELWEDVKDMYLQIDKMVGEILKVANKNTYIVLSSDHGNVPLDVSVNLNNLFAQKGWLKFTVDKKTGEPVIDWRNSKVIYLKMAHVYINTKGLSGDYNRDSGVEYEKLRNEVIKTLSDLKYIDGQKPVVEVVKWEDARQYLRIDPDRAGDLIIANSPGFGWNEEMTGDLKVFATPIITGYKQAIKAQDIEGMWTPFIIAGPGIKKNNFLGDKPFPLVDQYPTIMKALGVKSPDTVQGQILPVFKGQ